MTVSGPLEPSLAPTTLQASQQPDDEADGAERSLDPLQTNNRDDEPFVELYDGQGLRTAAADSAMRTYWTTVVSPLGRARSGKTTLLAGVYEQLLRGKLATSPGGSHTLVGFETRIHDARLASKRTAPDLERTGDLQFLQLLHRVSTKESSLRQMLLADVPGETFEKVRDGSHACKDFAFLSRSDYIPFLIDGAGLIDATSRVATVEDAHTILRRLKEQELLPQGTELQFLVTKADLIAAASDRALSAFVDTLIEQLTATYAGSSSSVTAMSTNLTSLFERNPEPALLDVINRWFRTQPISTRRAEDDGAQSQATRAIGEFGSLRQ